MSIDVKHVPARQPSEDTVATTRRLRPNNTEDDAFGKAGRRGPRNRFMTQRDREEEPLRITELMAKGMKVKDVAALMNISVPTVYRRIGKIPRSAAPKLVERSQEYEQRLTELLENTRVCAVDGHNRAAMRIARLHDSECCPECKSNKIAVELLRQSALQHKLEVRVMKHAGFFEHIRNNPEVIIRVIDAAEAKASSRLHKMGHRVSNVPGSSVSPNSGTRPESDEPTLDASACRPQCNTGTGLNKPDDTVRTGVEATNPGDTDLNSSRQVKHQANASPANGPTTAEKKAQSEQRNAALRQEQTVYEKRIDAFLRTHQFEGLSYGQIPRVLIEELALSLALQRTRVKAIFASESETHTPQN